MSSFARAIALVLSIALACGCTQSIDEAPVDPSSGNYLRVDGYTLVDDETLRGYLQWLYFVDDPEQSNNPGVACELWEELELTTAEASDSCAGCSLVFEGTALQHEDTTCEDISWTYRTLSLSYSPIEEAAPPASDYASDGYSHVVGSRWSPDAGEGEVFAPLFVAQPEQWDTAEGAAGSGLGESPLGQYRLSGLYYWEL